MRVLLIYPKICTIFEKNKIRFSPPLGLAYLGATLTEGGHVVKGLDMRFDKYDYAYLKRFVKGFSPGLIGISSPSFGFSETSKLARKLKKWSNARIVVGGPHASLCAEEILEENPQFDICVVGEGELTMPELCDSIEAKRPLEAVKGIVFRQKGKIVRTAFRPFIEDLDTIPFPRFEIFNIDDYNLKTLTISTSRGCPYGCVYCSSWVVIGKKFRPRSPKNVVDEMEARVNKYGCEHFELVDDNFMFDPKRASEIANLIIRRGLKVKLSSGGGIRADKVSVPLLRLLKKAGLYYIGVGIESGDPKVLKQMNKGETVEQIRAAVKAASKVGIRVSGFFMVGNPGDSIESTKKSIALLQELNLYDTRISMATPFPKTVLFNWVKSKGRFLQDEATYLTELPISPATSLNKRSDIAPVFETPDFTKEQRITAYHMLFEASRKATFTRRYGKINGVLIYHVARIEPLRKALSAMYSRLTEEK